MPQVYLSVRVHTFSLIWTAEVRLEILDITAPLTKATARHEDGVDVVAQEDMFYIARAGRSTTLPA